MAQDLLRDGVKVATNKTATVAFSPDDLKPDKEELNAKKMEERYALAETSKAKAETGAELLAAMLDRYKPEDFISVRMVGKVTPVKDSDNPDLCQVVAEVSFNDKYYYEKFVPDLKQVLNQISSRHKEIRLTKQRDIIKSIANKNGAPFANDSIIMMGSDLGKDFFVTVYDKPDRFGCTVYAFSKDDADKILNNQTGVLAKFKGRIATIKSFQL